MITFNEWYKEYPRKKSRGDAEKAWSQVLKAGHDPEDILEGLRRNLASMLRRDAQFIPYPASWLRAQGWWDEPDPITKGQDTTLKALDRMMNNGPRSDIFDALTQTIDIKRDADDNDGRSQTSLRFPAYSQRY